jgi:Protein of unknown function (DUF2783)
MPNQSLNTQSQFPDPDAAYRTIVEAHRGLSDDASQSLNAKLVLILANHIGNLNIVQEAIELAKREKA